MKKDWTYKKLGDCLSYIKNGANIKQTKGATGIPITRIETLSGGVFNRDRLGYADITDVKKYESFYLETGDLLLSHINSKTYIGRTVMYSQEAEEKIIHGMNLLRLKVIKEHLTPAFFCYYAKSDRFKADIVKIRKDAVNQSSICISDIVQITIPVPPISIQESIVRELDAIHGILEKKQEQLRELDNLAQAIFYEMFGDPITNPKQWEVKKLGEVCDKIGSGATPKGGNESYKEEGISLIRSLNVHNNQFLYKDLAHIDDKQADELKNVVVQEGDILLNITGASVARCSLVPVDVLPARVNQHVAIIRVSKDISNVFVNRQLTSHEYQQELLATSKGNGATREALTKGQIEQLNVILPPLSLQQSFAAKIEAIEAQKQAVQQSIREVEALLAERMDHYFS